VVHSMLWLGAWLGLSGHGGVLAALPEVARLLAIAQSGHVCFISVVCWEDWCSSDEPHPVAVICTSAWTQMARHPRQHDQRVLVRFPKWAANSCYICCNLLGSTMFYSLPSA
jgi:hypothetical protein